MADTSAPKKATIVALREAGLTTREVAKKENVAPSTVSRIAARYGPMHDFEAKGPRRGRKPLFTECDVRKAQNLLNTG
ncbi:unnamed protein product [Mycena citricolor]|uniref:Uncharacterized protein n=1 Tax=Mycena citricolor TaxID=2018698 RepID=A0AAD2H0N3_9AGAR|nr:unnamed protein product [Mycena citricolor]